MKHMRHSPCNRRGQVTAELAVLFTFVIAAFVFMGFYLQRGAQGGMKNNADSLGQQFSINTGFASTSRQQSRSVSGGSLSTTTSTSTSGYTHTLQ